MKENQLKVKIFTALTLAMGVASLVLLILKVVSTESALLLLSLGLVCQGFLNLEKGNKLTSK